jgi:hypothetical protein
MVKKNSDKIKDNLKEARMVIMAGFENLPAHFCHSLNHEQGYLTHD